MRLAPLTAVLAPGAFVLVLLAGCDRAAPTTPGPAEGELRSTAGAGGATGGEFASAGRGCGPLADEITRLRYPLRPGASRTIRQEPFFGSVVEAIEVLEVPAGRFRAARVRIDSELLTAEDEVLAWFGPCRLVRFHARLTSTTTDMPPLTLVATEEEVLESHALAPHAGCPAGR